MTKRFFWFLALCVAVVVTARPTYTQVTPAPILLVVNAGSPNPFGSYLGEILRAEGVNAFDVANLSALSGSLTGRRVVVLAETSLSATDVTTLTTFVNGGGRLVAMKPDAQLATLLGIVPQAGQTSNGYIGINTASSTGTGFTATTLPFKGAAAHYTLAGTATSLATLYSGQATATAFPAVIRNGNTATWTYDLARSVAYSRQGDPAFAGLDRDGLAPLRTNDIFYNTIDKDRVSLPHADIQMRLFARVIEDLLADALPLPKLWYFPESARTLLVVTSDSHANPQSYFDQMVAAFDARNVKSAIYINGGATPSLASVNAWRANGHEVGIHPNASGVGATIDSAIVAGQNYFTLGGFGAPSTTTRHHMIQWQGWVDAAKTQAAHGLNFDTSFYTWGPAVTYLDGHQAHGYINGSARPMRFVDETGAIVPVWQLVTSLIDEQLMVDAYSESLSTSQALAVSQQLINASQAGDYAAVMAQFHTDYFGWGDVQAWANGTLDYANSLNIPNRTPQSFVNFNLARAATTVSGITWVPGTRQLSFVVTVPVGSENQSIAVPGLFDGYFLTSVTRNGSPAARIDQTITGRATSFVSLPAGTHTLVVTYNTPVPPPEHPPVAVNDSATTSEGQAVVIDVLANDSDPDLDPLVVTSATGAAHGTTTINLDNTITYTPAPAHCSNPDSFTYVISDGRGGTASATVAVSITCVAGTFTHQTAADFGTAAQAGTMVTATGDGDVRLAGAMGDEYAVAPLDNGRWVAGTWAGGAYAPSLSGGVLTVADPAGAFVRSATDTTVNTLEFTGQFAAAPWQHVGFAQLEFSGYLMFSTFNNTTNLFARSNVAGAGEQRTDLGPIPSGSHVYRIERQAISPTQNAIAYYIDGTLRATHTVGVVPAMHIYQSHSGGATPALVIDRIWAFPAYVASGTFESVPYDAGAAVPWTAANWTASVPGGTALQLRTRTSPDGIAWTAWSSPLTVSGQAVSSPANRFLQYQLTLTSNSTAVSPVVDAVGFTYGSGSGGGSQPPPVAVNDSASTLSGQPVTIPVLANDSTTVGVLSVVSVTQGAFGTVVINPGGTLTYSAPFGQCGTDTFSYVATNSVSGSASANVTVTVSCLRGMVTHTTVSDFSAPAIATGTAVTATGDGAVRLAAAFTDDFALPTLNGAQWVAGTWAGGAYTPAISGGVLSVADANGAFVRSATTLPITTFDATLTFTGAAWEHAGWASQDFCCNYLIFSTANTSTNLYARSSTPTGEIRTDLGAIPAGSHAYRIERQAVSPTTDEISYVIDGVVRAQHTVATQPAMFVYFSHNSGATLPLAVDRVSVYPDYVASGTFVSKPMDSGVEGSTWTVANWTANVPAGATLLVSTRTSPDGSSWTAWSSPMTTSGSTITSVPNRYLQYQLALATSDLAAGPVVQSVEMRYSHAGSVAQATAAEFSLQSSGAGALVTSNGDGDVRLAGTQGDDFTAPALNGALWTAGTWAGGAYTPAISGGVLSISGANGAWVRSATTLPVTTLETTATFNTAPWQHVGFASEDFCCNYLIFSTANTSTNLYARSYTPSGEIRTDLGAIPTGNHTYRIQRQATSPTTDLISYVIDGVVVAQHTVATQPAMYVYLSHNAGAVSPLSVDRLWVYPTYVAAGSFTSGALDSGVDGSTWTMGNWTANTPAGTTLSVVTRTSADGLTWTAWSAPMTVSGTTLASPANRYLQYRIDMTTSDPAVSPVVDSVVMHYLW